MRILLFCLALLLTYPVYSQVNLTPKQIDSSLSRDIRKRKVFHISKATPSQTYVFNKRTKNLTYLIVTWPWEKVIEFYSMNNQLSKIRVSTRLEKTKHAVNIYYFDNDRLIFQDQTSKDITQDIGELKKLFSDFRNRSDSIKENWLQKRN